MLGRRLRLGVANARALSISKACRLHYFSRMTSSEATPSSSDRTEEQLDKLKDDLESDAYIRMLATPLRRCAATLLPLPRAVMFKMVSQRIQQSEDPALDISVPIEEPKVVNLVVKRRSRRYVLKEAKKTKEKALVRAQRLLQHKVVTSITPKSRDHFTGQLAHVKEQLVESRKPRRGILMPVGLTRKSLSQSRGIGQGRGVWITLSKKIAAQASEKKNVPTLPSTSPSPSNLLDLVQEGLEERVLEEARLLLQRVTSDPSSSDDRFGWLVRRLIGKEMWSVMQHGRVELRDGEKIRMACLVVKEGQMPTLQQGVDVYDLQSLIINEQRRTEVKRSFQSIAIFLNRQQMKLRRKQNAPQGSKSEAVDDEFTEEQEQIDSSIREQGIKWPRILAVRRSERTVDLCIALWRLNAWCRSG